MDFITGLPMSDGNSVICTLICKLTKKRHYVLCLWGENGTPTEFLVWIVFWNLYRFYGIPFFLTSDKKALFVSLLWEIFCRNKSKFVYSLSSPN